MTVNTPPQDQKWAQRWIRLAHEVASWSKDDTQVGAVIFDQNRNPRGFGYNGIPRHLDDQVPERLEKPLKHLYFEHAERNVLYACARSGIPVEGCVLATTHWPCCDCTRGIIQSGIQCVLVDETCMDPQGSFHVKWRDQIWESKKMLDEAGIEWHLVPGDPPLEP